MHNPRITNKTNKNDKSLCKQGNPLGSSDTQSFGGALATAYAQDGNLDDVSPETVGDALATSKADAEMPASDNSALPPPSGGSPDTPHGCNDDNGRNRPLLWKDDENKHAKDDWLKKWLTPDDLALAREDHGHQSYDQELGKSVSDPRVGYAVSWACLRDKLAGRLSDDGVAPDWRSSIAGHDLLGTSIDIQRSAYGPASVAISGNLLKPFEGLKEGFDRLR